MNTISPTAADHVWTAVQDLIAEDIANPSTPAAVVELANGERIVADVRISTADLLRMWQ